MSVLDEFKPKKKFLICIDSDGCVMDTMDIKHIKCFGPCMIKEWNLEAKQDKILKRWNEINLYSGTRGINRFKGLALALKEIDTQDYPIFGINELVNWTLSAKELSNQAVEKMIPQNLIFEKVLNWSKEVNRAITELPEEEKKPFPNALDTIKELHEEADIVIVSSANAEAVKEEWEKYGFMPYVDCMCAQDVGTKAYCISRLIEKGYPKNQILMCGDAPGDLEAAEKNGVQFFPIQVKKEAQSWIDLKNDGAKRLFAKNYEGEYANTMKLAFYKNLGV